MHNPQAFLPVENSAVPAVQCLVWTVLPLLYIYNKRQGRSTTVLALSVKACRLCQFPRGGSQPSQAHSVRQLPRGGNWHRAAMTERVRAVLPQEAGAADAGRLYDPTRENGIPERPQTLRYAENINNPSAEDG